MLEETIAQQKVAGFSLKYKGQITGNVEAKIITTRIFFICLVFKVITPSLFSLGISVSCCVF